jgi:hypothetical protein
MLLKAKFIKIFLSFSIIFLIGKGVFAYSESKRPKVDINTAGYPTGVLPYDPQKLDAWAQKAKRLKNVCYNVLAMERINQHRLKKGRSPYLIQRKKSIQSKQPSSLINQIENTKLTETVYYAQSIAAEELLPVVDNSQLQYFPPIGYQEGGSCQSWAATYYLMTHMTALARNWNVKHNGARFYLSPRWTYNLINRGKDQGAYLEQALDLNQEYGAATWAEFYESVIPTQQAWPQNPAVWRNAINLKMKEKGYLLIDQAEGLKNIKALLNNGYVLAFTTFIDAWEGTRIVDDTTTSSDDLWVGEKACFYLNEKNHAGHCMTCVGYNDNLWVDINDNGKVDAGEKGALKIANSWGKSWNNQGFIWLAYDALYKESQVAQAPAMRQQAFWGNRCYWMTAYAGYAPQKLVAITLKALYRGDLKIQLGIKHNNRDDSQSIPDFEWSEEFLPTYLGGALSFDGYFYANEKNFIPEYTLVLDLKQLVDKDQNDDEEFEYSLKIVDKNQFDQKNEYSPQLIAFSVWDGQTDEMLAWGSDCDSYNLETEQILVAENIGNFVELPENMEPPWSWIQFTPTPRINKLHIRAVKIPEVIVYPNPASEQLRFRLPGQPGEVVHIKIFNVAGEKVSELRETLLASGQQVVTWDCHHIASGIYVGQVIINGRSAKRIKIAIVH